MIAIGADHGGYKLKGELEKYFEEKGIEYKDYGTYSEERTDFPIYAKRVAEAVKKGIAEYGILVCRSGYGMTIAANKFRGIRAASITSETLAIAAKADDDVNVITLCGDYMGIDEAIKIFEAWQNTKFKYGRYQERLDMIEEIENENMK